MDTSSATIPTRRPHPGRLFLWLGLAIGLLGPFLYFLQLQAQRLTAPWYLPILGTLAAGVAQFAFLRTRGLWRLPVAVLLVLLASGEWYFLLSSSKLPAYTGPADGEPFPAFSTTCADGKTFDETDLKGSQPTAMVFFRGRW